MPLLPDFISGERGHFMIAASVKLEYTYERTTR